MKLIVAAALAFALPATALCQEIDPVSVSPDMYKVLLENDYVRVVQYTIKPGETDKPHTHPAKVSYVVNGGTLQINLGDSSFVTTDPSGEATFRGAVPRHTAANIGTTPVTIVLFEIKKIDAPVVPAGEDPFANNPSTLKVLLENDSVRVMEAAIPPGHKEKQHTHPPYAMYVMNSGSVRMHFADGTTRDVQFNAGEARFSDRVTHWAENTGTSTVRIILVEIRHR
jgi:quercetin dioxygenase-like cupin family protein